MGGFGKRMSAFKFSNSHETQHKRPQNGRVDPMWTLGGFGKR